MATATLPRVSPTDHALGIVPQHAVIPVDDHPGYFYVTDTANGPPQTYIATSLECNCADYAARCRPCQHMAVVKRETAALCAYAADWDRMATQGLTNTICTAVLAMAGRRWRPGRRVGVGQRRRRGSRTATGDSSGVRQPQEPPGIADDHQEQAMDAALERQELEGVVQDLLGLLVFTAQDRVLETAAPIPWKVGLALISDPDEAIRLLALTLTLEAVLQRPDVLRTAARDLHARLAAIAPRLERPTRTPQEAGDDHPAG